MSVWRCVCSEEKKRKCRKGWPRAGKPCVCVGECSGRDSFICLCTCSKGSMRESML